MAEVWESLSPKEKKDAYDRLTKTSNMLPSSSMSVGELRAWARTRRALSPDNFEAYLSFLHESQGFVRDALLLYELEQDPDCVHWQAADLSHLGEFEPFDWGEAGEPPLEALRYIEGQGWVNG